MKRNGNSGSNVFPIRVAKDVATPIVKPDLTLAELAGICLSCGDETDYGNYCSGCDAWICSRCRGGFKKVRPGPHSPDGHPGSPYHQP